LCNYNGCHYFNVYKRNNGTIQLEYNLSELDFGSGSGTYNGYTPW